MEEAVDFFRSLFALTSESTLLWKDVEVFTFCLSVASRMISVQLWRLLMAASFMRILGFDLEAEVESAVSCKMEMSGKKQVWMYQWSMEQCPQRLTGLPLVVVQITRQLWTRLVEFRSLLQVSAQYVVSFLPSFQGIYGCLLVVCAQVAHCGRVTAVMLSSNPFCFSLYPDYRNWRNFQDWCWSTGIVQFDQVCLACRWCTPRIHLLQLCISTIATLRQMHQEVLG